ncbi:MAG: cytochrome c-type biogenesis protein CcmH [Brucellaceae bacterium]|nr:cytochrome c-type biogenesis protein CcmH [Brucellaceae bacterium]
MTHRLRRHLAAGLLAVGLGLAAVGQAAAVEPDEVLPDPALEQRAREISAELRCMVCQNQSIDDSNAELAKDLRVLVRDRLRAGDTNDEVFEFVVARYGEFVLLKPRFSTRNLILWGAPLLLLVAGGAMIVAGARRRRVAGAPLTEDENERLAKLLRKHGSES